MSELGDILELMHTSDERWRTLRAEGRQWRHLPVLHGAFHRQISDRSRSVAWARGPKPRAAPNDPALDEREDVWRLWLAPERVRVEFAVGDETVTMTQRGRMWRSWSPSYGGQSNQGRPNYEHGRGPGSELAQPWNLLSAFDLEVRGRGSHLGREVYLVRGVPAMMPDDREGQIRGAHGLGAGAEEYLLLVDAARGVLMRSEARLHGRPFRVIEMLSVGFDEDLEPDLFGPPGPAGSEFEAFEDDRSALIEDLADAVDFAVWVPQHVPAEAEPEARIIPARPRQGIPRSVQVSYSSYSSGNDPGFWLSLLQSAEPMPAPPEVTWRDEGEFRVGSPDRTGRGRVRVVRGSTHVELTGEEGSERTLVAYARALVRLPSGPPDLAPEQS